MIILLVKLLTLVIAPIIVGVCLELFKHWLENNDRHDDR
ncbi:type I toxin-antitoxin system Fst family toxin [Ligilactobacillus salitolerans]|nr:type I toxin-antitoxin system Fst family toxin [Ligilactobacillus salitolerans]